MVPSTDAVQRPCGYSHHTFMCHNYHVKYMTKYRMFHEWIQGCNQQDDNICGACARPRDERSLVPQGCGRWAALVLRGVKENTTKTSCMLAKGWWGWVFANVDGVVCVHDEDRSVLRDDMYWGKAQQHARSKRFISKIEIAIIGGAEVWSGGSEVLWEGWCDVAVSWRAFKQLDGGIKRRHWNLCPL